MKKLRLLAGLYAALAAMTGCVVEVNFEPIGGDVSVDGAWTINGGPASTASCNAAGIQTVRLQICEFVDGDCYTASSLQAACSAGGFTTAPFLLADTYALRWQAVATNGTISNGEWQTVTAPAGSTIETNVNFATALPDEDTLAGTWTVGGQPANATSCAAAGIMNVRLASPAARAASTAAAAWARRSPTACSTASGRPSTQPATCSRRASSRSSSSTPPPSPTPPSRRSTSPPASRCW
ncbi:MAG: hypothetical protein MUE69_32965 [Myxococcota bacterium]|nr:hypothetical protein [Myxococcota bacterium]